MKEDEIANQFKDRIVEIIKRDHEEILNMVKDYKNVQRSLEKEPLLFELLEAYNGAIIDVIQGLLHLRHEVGTNKIKEMAEEEKRKG